MKFSQRRRALRIESLETRSLLATVTARFDDVPLAAESGWGGPDPAGALVEQFGYEVRAGSFKSSGLTFSNTYSEDFGFWVGGFGYSSVTDNVAGDPSHLFGAYDLLDGGGNGDDKFGVANSSFPQSDFSASNPEYLTTLPTISLPRGATISQVAITNSTYTANIIRNGDPNGFAKKFGGESGNDPDWLKLTVYGTDSAGNLLGTSVDRYLADYRFADNAQDYLLSSWTSLDLSSLAAARKLYFHLSSTDSGLFGMNTPSFFAIDDITFTAPINTAPQIDIQQSPTLVPIAEDVTNPAGTRIPRLLSGASDADAGASRGIAIVKAGGTTAGTWQYSLNDGTDWLPLGEPSAAEARLLPGTLTAKVRFIPNANFNGQVALYYRAWDQNLGTPGNTADLTGGGKVGGATAFSSLVESAMQVVTPVEDAPTLTGSGSVGYRLGSASAALSNTFTLSDPDTTNYSGGILRVRITSGVHASNRLEIGGPFTLSGQDVQLDGVTIGTLNVNGGVGNTTLIVQLTENATKTAVTKLLRSIRFRTEGTSITDSREINFWLTQADGKSSNTVTKQVNIVS